MNLIDRIATTQGTDVILRVDHERTGHDGCPRRRTADAEVGEFNLSKSLCPQFEPVVQRDCITSFVTTDSLMSLF
jgi:hypothetical protein